MLRDTTAMELYSNSEERPSEAASPAFAAETQLWSELTAPGNDRVTSYRAWSTLQCGLIGGATAALLVLREGPGISYCPVAFWPDPERDLGELAHIAQRAIAEQRS